MGRIFVGLYIYSYSCMCSYICKYIYAYFFSYIYTCLGARLIATRASTPSPWAASLSAYIYIHIHVRVHIFVYIYICICFLIYIYMFRCSFSTATRASTPSPWVASLWAWSSAAPGAASTSSTVCCPTNCPRYRSRFRLFNTRSRTAARR